MAIKTPEQLDLLPKQESTGDRTILGKISKRGNKYLRTLFVQAAHVVLVRRPRAAMRGLWPWIEQASKRLHRNMHWGVGSHGLGFVFQGLQCKIVSRTGCLVWPGNGLATADWPLAPRTAARGAATATWNQQNHGRRDSLAAVFGLAGVQWCARTPAMTAKIMRR